ncbi:MAG: Hsp33 family molecular chaperone HslO, partial [Clostridia bacterium]|nr:Hsp33 family molecular chaperone HslO [Clostridia bacterium]
MIRALSRDGFVDVIVSDSTRMVEEARRIHGTLPTATAALGRLLTAASMMGSDLKEDSATLTLRVRGDGEIGTLLCSAGSDASARGT